VSLIDFDTVDRLEISLQFAGDELTVETGLQQWQHLRLFVASRELATCQSASLAVAGAKTSAQYVTMGRRCKQPYKKPICRYEIT